ncbi:formate dehydrogenase accessory sulfurtransferase FdhD [Roseimicrobium sp. ORNL1]|uniref:formate dehydrogenase accessory sulfurtransferase FdhD n=1 Tax=Roseimicrobium sp. ORNL1 TaxID=2711231 RepID=UPI001F0D613A|nr:formate dehydrogenase accessory sulfurtransferase FdhD [Roseimicrobium sp. ORNL1]
MSDADLDASTPVRLSRLVRGEAAIRADDVVATEEPLEIRVEGRSLAVVMRTPGHDEELTAGFLLTEGVVQHGSQIFELSVCPSRSEGQGNVADVLLSGVEMNWDSLTRHVFSGSSCGVCGKATIDSVFQKFPAVTTDWQVSSDLLLKLPDKLRASQSTFEQTGGLHASALFDLAGNLIVLREDVGRHNALDKVLGFALMSGALPLSKCILMVSGRVSFEIMQKALAGGIPLVAAVSAPSSLAVQFARDSRQTLVGFLRGDRMNVYTGRERVVHEG